MPTALLEALYQRQAAVVREMLAANPSLDIFEASAVGDAARVRQLLASDPSLANALADDGFRPVHLAAYFGHPEVVRLLLDSGADRNAIAGNASRVTPLHSAASSRQLAIMTMLLQAGADANARQSGGWTALHSAAHQDNPDAVRLLLSHGADPTLAADDGRCRPIWRKRQSSKI
jgi:ankyrin repeat protein